MRFPARSGVTAMSENSENSTAGDDLTHTTDDGDVQMVDVGDKPDTARRAVARGEIRLVVDRRRDSCRRNREGRRARDGRVGAVQAVKHTWETIPMCHQIPITNVETKFDVRDDRVVLQRSPSRRPGRRAARWRPWRASPLG